MASESSPENPYQYQVFDDSNAHPNAPAEGPLVRIAFDVLAQSSGFLVQVTGALLLTGGSAYFMDTLLDGILFSTAAGAATGHAVVDWLGRKSNVMPRKVHFLLGMASCFVCVFLASVADRMLPRPAMSQLPGHMMAFMMLAVSAALALLVAQVARQVLVSFSRKPSAGN